MFSNSQQPAEAGHPGLTGVYQQPFHRQCTRMFGNSPCREPEGYWGRNLSSP
jgi:hypothetical protein